MRVFNGSGKSYTLNVASPLGAGGEATVYPVVEDASLAAKVYHRPTDDHAKKLAVMQANPPENPTASQRHSAIAWPVDLIHTSPGGPCVGFLMRKVSGLKPIFSFYNPKSRREQSPFFNTLYLHRTARNLAAVVHALHEKGYVVGDLNESNILMADTALVTLVDTDSFQVQPSSRAVYRCPVGKPDFTPPELQGKSFAKTVRTPEHDRFGLAVLLYQLLLEGTHPYDGQYTGTEEPPLRHERIKAGHCPAVYRRIPYRPSPTAPPLSHLDPALQKLFHRCFRQGNRFPRLRPTAQAWMNAIQKAEANLIACKRNPNHRHSRHLKTCPWCERTALLGGRDPFPASQSAVPTSPPPRPAPRPATPILAVAVPTKPAKHAKSSKLKGTSGTKGKSNPKPAPLASTGPAAGARLLSLQGWRPRLPAYGTGILRRPSGWVSPFRRPLASPPPVVVAISLEAAPTVWTGLTLLFALLAILPDLSIGAGLSALGCYAVEYRKMRRVTLGSLLGAGIGGGMALRTLAALIAMLAATGWSSVQSLTAFSFLRPAPPNVQKVKAGEIRNNRSVGERSHHGPTHF